MNDRRLMATGIIATVVAALCCATPILASLLGALGLSAVLGYLDDVLVPAMVIFIGITLYAIAKQRRA